MRLSICIATFNRAAYLPATLESLLPQLLPGVEVVILDGASPDNTAELVTGYAARYPQLRYVREDINSGVDIDFDKAVLNARGEYCWLMSDDDLVCDGAVARVLDSLSPSPELVLVNADMLAPDMRTVIVPRVVNVEEDRDYGVEDWPELFCTVGSLLTYIGSVCIRRDLWLSRERALYFGSCFIHAGVICQPPQLRSVRFVSQPLIHIRSGNAMWTSRAFEIWLIKWPQLVWSFQHLPLAARQQVAAKEPWKSPKILFYWRAKGGYNLAIYQALLRSRLQGIRLWMAAAIACFPQALANILATAYLLTRGKASSLDLYELMQSPVAPGWLRSLVHRAASRNDSR